MMKRILSLALAVVLIVVLAVPVQATEVDSPWLEVLDVASVNNTGRNSFTFNNTGTINLDVGFKNIVNFIDITFVAYEALPTAVTLRRTASNTIPLTIQNVGGRLYRAYGNVGAYLLQDIELTFTSSGYSSYELMSCKIASIEVNHYPVSYTPDLAWGAGDGAETSTGGIIYANTSLEYGMNYSYSLSLTLNDWQKFDFVEMSLITGNASITSVSAKLGTNVLPVEVSFLQSAENTDTITDYYTASMQPSVDATIFVDLRSVSRTTGYKPVITISGVYHSGVGMSIDVGTSMGFVEYTNKIGVRFWFDKAASFFTDLFGEDEGQESVDNLDQGSASISQGAADIGSFEESQQSTLNSGFSTIQTGISFTSFSAALLFVQKYVNMTFEGISQYAIVFTLPLFLGLFFYLCSRIPGVTRWKSRPPQSKGGESP